VCTNDQLAESLQLTPQHLMHWKRRLVNGYLNTKLTQLFEHIGGLVSIFNAIEGCMFFLMCFLCCMCPHWMFPFTPESLLLRTFPCTQTLLSFCKASPIPVGNQGSLRTGRGVYKPLCQWPLFPKLCPKE
jgi:hypothetical protein